ncbi:hypothetical protein COLSTE_00028 [Collinsella stercoris DSM 13279]|uniref:Uncharacterized protein n=1 Tax=Collinsella stercoris DSM 13279 TaxID=445975 RepID=B6G7I9_9ACTN|nr:hypothetical protein COLSTE_00028 [Collinsella stercoris DSM 13279]
MRRAARFLTRLLTTFFAARGGAACGRWSRRRCRGWWMDGAARYDGWCCSRAKAGSLSVLV